MGDTEGKRKHRELGSGGITYFGSCNEGMSEKLNSPISSYLEQKKAANSAKVLHCFPFMLSNLSPRCIGMLSGQCFYTTSFSLWPFLILYFFFFLLSWLAALFGG